MNFIIIFLFSIFFHYLTSEQIIYEFKRDFELNEKMTDEQIYLKLSYNDIYTYIKIGTPEKELKVGITFKEKSLTLLSSKIKNREAFDETSSSSYKSLSETYGYESQILSANISEEYIKLNNINTKKKITLYKHKLLRINKS